MEVVLPIWKIEKRGLGNEAREESANILMTLFKWIECGEAQVSPLPCRVFLELFRDSLKALALAHLTKASLVTQIFQVLDFSSHIFSAI